MLNEINIEAVVCVNIDNDRCPPLAGAKKRYFNIMVALSRQKIHVQIECRDLDLESLPWQLECIYMSTAMSCTDVGKTAVKIIFGILNSTIGRPNQLILVLRQYSIS